MKTIREHLTSLPPGYRELALANMDPASASCAGFTKPEYALCGAFDFDSTKEGREFWDKVILHLFGYGDPLPPLPKPNATLDYFEATMKRDAAALKHSTAFYSSMIKLNPRLTALLSEHASLLALLSENVTKANCETLRAINRELAKLVDMQPVEEKTMEVEPL